MIRFLPLCLLVLALISLVVCKCSSSSIINPSKVKQVSWKPRAFVYEGFLTAEECDHLISLAKSELKRSSVADNLSGESKLSEVRTSSGMFISKAKDPIVAGIEDKISSWTFLPKENGEDIQVLRYEHGQKYDPHYDYFADKVNIARGGHRLATVLMYLSDVEKVVKQCSLLQRSLHVTGPINQMMIYLSAQRKVLRLNHEKEMHFFLQPPSDCRSRS